LHLAHQNSQKMEKILNKKTNSSQQNKQRLRRSSLLYVDK